MYKPSRKDEYRYLRSGEEQESTRQSRGIKNGQQEMGKESWGGENFLKRNQGKGETSGKETNYWMELCSKDEQDGNILMMKKGKENEKRETDISSVLSLSFSYTNKRDPGSYITFQMTTTARTTTATDSNDNPTALQVHIPNTLLEEIRHTSKARSSTILLIGHRQHFRRC